MRFSENIRSILIPLIAASFVSACATLDGTDKIIDPLQVDQSAADAAPKQADDAAIFADLKQDQKQDQVAQTEKTGAPFYSAIGGENLGRVAYALYSDRKMTGKLAKMNPEIQAAGTLTVGQQVFFEMAGLKPNPMYLTKDLLERYPQELANALDTSGANETITVSAGETLQSVSQRLYGTTRYWTEIYLLNRDKLTSFDKVTKGIEVRVVHRNNSPAPVVRTETIRERIVEKLPEQPKIVEAPRAVEKIEPQEEHLTADVMVPVPEQPKAVEAPKPQPQVAAPPRLEEPAPSSGDGFWNSTNIRRVVYVGLILIITFFAFYMTRPSKKQKFDILDMTASNTEAGKRPKLSRDDNDRNIVG
jgi:hypothetical protein